MAVSLADLFFRLAKLTMIYTQIRVTLVFYCLATFRWKIVTLLPTIDPLKEDVWKNAKSIPRN